ncbi:MAG TPA: hydrogenase subunit MbhD domain-containing protein [Longimicrobiales bacterium]|nr:hydrogenase subunit MbhD domain-containing protein [Longimicrobiales bacterium]
MNALMTVGFLVVASAGTGVVLARDPGEQAVSLGLFGLLLAVLFLLLDAPGVALSELVVGAVAVPLMVLLALSKAQDYARRHRDAQEPGEPEEQQEAEGEGEEEGGGG